jgi:hypothetical protein
VYKAAYSPLFRSCTKQPTPLFFDRVQSNLLPSFSIVYKAAYSPHFRPHTKLFFLFYSQNIAPEGPTAGGIDRENRDGSVLLHGQEAPLPGTKSVMPAPWEEKRRIQGPVKFESTNTDDHSSDAAFLDTLRRLRDDQPLKTK